MSVCPSSETRRCALIIATLTSFLPPFMASSINIALPAIGSEFSMDAVLLGWIATSYLLSAAVFMVPFGKFADIYGMKKIFFAGLFIFTASSLVAFFAPTSALLIGSRVLQGIGSAMIFGTGTAILVNVFPLQERGRVLGINAASVYLGLTLGPFLGGLLTHYLGWRSLFLVNVPLGLIPLSLGLWKLKGEWAAARGESFDLTGSAIYSLMLVAVMYGFSLLPSGKGAALVLLGAATFLLLIRWESGVACPVLDVGLFRNNRVYAFSNLAALISYAATFAITFLLSLYLQYIKGLEPDQAGLILLAQPLVMTFFSPYTGKLSDRMEPRLVASAGMALTFAAVLALAFLGRETTFFHHRLPAHPGAGAGTIHLARHQCHHVLGAAAPLRRGLGYPGNHAPGGAGCQHELCHDGRLPGRGRDPAPVLSPVPGGGEGGLCRLFRRLPAGDLCLSGQRQIEESILTG